MSPLRGGYAAAASPNANTGFHMQDGRDARIKEPGL